MHTLILGQSFTGKSALAKQLGTQLRVQRQKVIAFNPTLEPGYSRPDNFDCCAADFETADPTLLAQEITRLIKEGHNKIFVIIDEAHLFFEKYSSQYEWMATRGRHYGIHVIAITQRGAKLNTTFRSQCSTIYVFRLNRSDMEFITEEFWHQKITRDRLNLPDGKYLKISKTGVFEGDISDW